LAGINFEILVLMVVLVGSLSVAAAHAWAANHLGDPPLMAGTPVLPGRAWTDRHVVFPLVAISGPTAHQVGQARAVDFRTFGIPA
jgi:hypothetical protein